MAEPSIRCVIVDDEPDARELLRELVAGHAGLEVIGDYGDPVEALEAITDDPPELLFLDIEMPGLNGFELLGSLDWAHLPAVIFVTAYDEYAVRAFEVNAVDYLLKPFHRQRFDAAIDKAVAAIRARARHPAAADDGGMRGALRSVLNEMARNTPSHTARFAVKAGHRIRLLPADAIDLIESEANYVRLHAGNDSYVLRDSLSAVEARLEPSLFARVHRKHIVNVARVQEIEPLLRGEYVLIMRGGRRVTTGRTYRARVRELFDLRA